MGLALGGGVSEFRNHLSWRRKRGWAKHHVVELLKNGKWKVLLDEETSEPARRGDSCHCFSSLSVHNMHFFCKELEMYMGV